MRITLVPGPSCTWCLGEGEENILGDTRFPFTYSENPETGAWSLSYDPEGTSKTEKTAACGCRRHAPDITEYLEANRQWIRENLVDPVKVEEDLAAYEAEQAELAEMAESELPYDEDPEDDDQEDDDQDEIEGDEEGEEEVPEAPEIPETPEAPEPAGSGKPLREAVTAALGGKVTPKGPRASETLQERLAKAKGAAANGKKSAVSNPTPEQTDSEAEIAPAGLEFTGSAWKAYFQDPNYTPVPKNPPMKDSEERKDCKAWYDDLDEENRLLVGDWPAARFRNEVTVFWRKSKRYADKYANPAFAK